ncbi:MAG: hypothetical protein GY696_39890 [Gammaproteobacteria bacterium]|nr:hypothetical protein [Gammaproteobacteria bacterium]
MIETLKWKYPHDYIYSGVAGGGGGRGPPRLELCPKQTPGGFTVHKNVAGALPTQPNWIQTNLATKRRDQTGGLIES